MSVRRFGSDGHAGGAAAAARTGTRGRSCAAWDACRGGLARFRLYVSVKTRETEIKRRRDRPLHFSSALPSPVPARAARVQRIAQTRTRPRHTARRCPGARVDERRLRQGLSPALRRGRSSQQALSRAVMSLRAPGQRPRHKLAHMPKAGHMTHTCVRGTCLHRVCTA